MGAGRWCELRGAASRRRSVARAFSALVQQKSNRRFFDCGGQSGFAPDDTSTLIPFRLQQL
jgi:hypothetical protein